MEDKRVEGRSSGKRAGGQMSERVSWPVGRRTKGRLGRPTDGWKDVWQGRTGEREYGRTDRRPADRIDGRGRCGNARADWMDGRTEGRTD